VLFLLIIIIIIEIMWNVKVKVIPLRVGANGTISKSFRQYLSNTSAKREMNYGKQPYWALRTYCEKY
jgi:hypothetical protein